MELPKSGKLKDLAAQIPLPDGQDPSMWSKIWAACIYTRPPEETTESTDIIRPRMIQMIRNKELGGKPICFEHNHADICGLIFGSACDINDGTTWIFFRVSFHSPRGRIYNDWLSEGLIRGVSLAHVRHGKSPVEVSLCLTPARNDAWITMSHRPASDPPVDPVPFSAANAAALIAAAGDANIVSSPDAPDMKALTEAFVARAVAATKAAGLQPPPVRPAAAAAALPVAHTETKIKFPDIVVSGDVYEKHYEAIAATQLMADDLNALFPVVAMSGLTATAAQNINSVTAPVPSSSTAGAPMSDSIQNSIAGLVGTAALQNGSASMKSNAMAPGSLSAPILGTTAPGSTAADSRSMNDSAPLSLPGGGADATNSLNQHLQSQRNGNGAPPQSRNNGNNGNGNRNGNRSANNNNNNNNNNRNNSNNNARNNRGGNAYNRSNQFDQQTHRRNNNTRGVSSAGFDDGDNFRTNGNDRNDDDGTGGGDDGGSDAPADDADLYDNDNDYNTATRNNNSNNNRNARNRINNRSRPAAADNNDDTSDSRPQQRRRVDGSTVASANQSKLETLLSTVRQTGGDTVADELIDMMTASEQNRLAAEAQSKSLKEESVRQEKAKTYAELVAQLGATIKERHGESAEAEAIIAEVKKKYDEQPIEQSIIQMSATVAFASTLMKHKPAERKDSDTARRTYMNSMIGGAVSSSSSSAAAAAAGAPASATAAQTVLWGQQITDSAPIEMSEIARKPKDWIIKNPMKYLEAELNVNAHLAGMRIYRATSEDGYATMRFEAPKRRPVQ